MSKIALSGNASGTGTFTFAAPGTNTDRTLTLPDASGTVATTADLGSITHLGTIATTSGSSVTLSGLTLTDYKQLQFSINGLSGGGVGTNVSLLLNGYLVAVFSLSAATDVTFGGGTIDLSNGVFWSSYAGYSGTTFRGSGGFGGLSGLTTASTSITFSNGFVSFDAGSIRIYGVK
jgi:hypothetical protein